MAYMAMVVGLNIKVMPPARASADTPSSRALRALSRATRLEEQAVSIAMLGPLRPYRYDMRPAGGTHKFLTRHTRIITLACCDLVLLHLTVVLTAYKTCVLSRDAATTAHTERCAMGPITHVSAEVLLVRNGSCNFSFHWSSRVAVRRGWTGGRLTALNGSFAALRRLSNQPESRQLAPCAPSLQSCHAKTQHKMCTRSDAEAAASGGIGGHPAVRRRHADVLVVRDAHEHAAVGGQPAAGP